MSQVNLQRINFTEVFFHIIFWLLIIHFIFDFGGLYHSYKHLVSGNDNFDEAIIYLPLLIFLFYWNLFFLISKFLNKGRWKRYSILLFVSFPIIYFLAIFLFDLVILNGFTIELGREHFSDHFITFGLLAVVISSSLGIAKMALQNASKKKAAEEKQKEAELKYLSNQFSPHFLFNTLNSLYSKALEEGAKETAESIVMLAEIMRYPINQGLKKEVTLEEEVKFINEYIELQKIRLGEVYPIVFDCHMTSGKVKILPLSLIELVENAFKYGVSQKTKAPINFELKQNEKTITFNAINNIIFNNKVNSNEIGLKNLRARFQLFYKDSYSLTTRINGNCFYSRLELPAEMPADNTW